MATVTMTLWKRHVAARDTIRYLVVHFWPNTVHAPSVTPNVPSIRQPLVFLVRSGESFGRICTPTHVPSKSWS